MNTVIVTGGAGFVGRHLVTELAEHWRGARIIVWDKKLEGLPSHVEGVAVDITQPETYRQSLQKVQPDWVVHLAAIAAVPVALQNPALVREINVHGTQRLLEAVRKVSSNTKVFFVSTADIYGVSKHTQSGRPIPELPLTEAAPKNPYAQSKYDAERIIEDSFSNQVVRVRPFPHIGPGQGLGFVTADFASQIAAIEASLPAACLPDGQGQAGKQLPVIKVGNLEAKRDFTDVRDVVRAYRLLLEGNYLGEVFHVASGRAVAIQSMLDMLLSLSNSSITVQQDPSRLRPSDNPVIVGDTTKLKKATGWMPRIPLEQSLRDALEDWRARQAKE